MACQTSSYRGSNSKMQLKRQLSLERILGFKPFFKTLKKHIQTIKPMPKNFALWITHVFEEYEFLVAGSNHDSIKKLLSPIISKAVTNDRYITKLLKSQTSELNKQSVQSQVSVMDSQWFVFNEDAKRVKLNYDSTGEYSFIQKGGKKG